MKWFYRSSTDTWRLLDDNSNWLGSVWGRDGQYFVDLPSDKWPFQLRKGLGPQTLTNAKKLVVAHVVGERVSK